MIIALYENLTSLQNYKNLEKYFICKNLSDLKNNHYDDVVAIFVKLKKQILLEDIKKFVNLKYILTPTTGLNHIERKIVNSSKFKIISLKDFKSKIKKITSTSEFALSIILASSRKILEHSMLSKKNIFSRYAYKTFQFRNTTVGIVGYGRVGQYVAKKLINLGFKIIIFDKKKIFNKNKNFKPLNYLMRHSDIISIHIDYSPQNKNFINKKYFNLCKKKPSIINTSRGEVLNEVDLISSLEKGKISTAYLDVISNEQIETSRKKSKLFNLNKGKKLFLFPHLGGSTIDAMIETENLIIKNFLKIYNED